jgi:hypothetical protein
VSVLFSLRTGPTPIGRYYFGLSSSENVKDILKLLPIFAHFAFSGSDFGFEKLYFFSRQVEQLVDPLVQLGLPA